ncbi:MAG: 50S ribosomal protein L24 [Chlamydiota bacterium]|jgi:large subunit ribosomal protein L24
MNNKWIRKGDKVVVLSGNDKGKVGEVLDRTDDRVLVQGVNLRKKHMKARQQGQSSQIIEMERPIHISNVKISSSDGAPLKLKVKMSQKGSKKLVYIDGEKEKTFRDIKKQKGK